MTENLGQELARAAKANAGKLTKANKAVDKLWILDAVTAAKKAANEGLNSIYKWPPGRETGSSERSNDLIAQLDRIGLIVRQKTSGIIKISW